MEKITQAVCEKIFSTIENRVLIFSFIYKIEIWYIFTSTIQIQKIQKKIKSAFTVKKLKRPAKDSDMLQSG